MKGVALALSFSKGLPSRTIWNPAVLVPVVDGSGLEAAGTRTREVVATLCLCKRKPDGPASAMVLLLR